MNETLFSNKVYQTTAFMATADESKPSRGRDRERQVRTLFSEIAPRYDLLNHLLSLNVDRVWRRRAVDCLEWADRPQGFYLDACAGTFDLSLELTGRQGFSGTVVASDFARPMLVEGKGKLVGEAVVPVCGDTLRLPFSDGIFKGAMVAFGVRNLSDVQEGFQELARVLEPGARLVVLEFTEPPNPIMRRLYLFYFHRILPLIGRIVSGHSWAYTYLPKSVTEFPEPARLAEMMREAGFKDARWEFLTGGIAALHVAVR